MNSSLWPPQTIVDHKAVLLPRLESLAINDSGACETMTIIFNAIKVPDLTRLSYQWFNRHSSGDDSTITLPTPVILLLENSTLIGDLSLDGGLSSQDIQECLRCGECITHVIFGKPPPTTACGLHLSPPPFTDPDLVLPDPFDLKILSIGSGAVTLFPRLESLEAYYLSSLTDEDLVDMIMSRIDASQ